MGAVIRLARPDQERVPTPEELLLASAARQEQLLAQILAQLQVKKRWTFAIAKDNFGRPVSIDAEQL